MKRSHRVVVSCHCLPNGDAVSKREAASRGIPRGLLAPGAPEGTGIFPPPRLERALPGLKRREESRENLAKGCRT